MVNTVLPVKRGLSSPAVISIPEKWDKQWFRYFIDNFLVNADIRNVTATGGITVSGNVSGNSTSGPPSSTVVISQSPIPNNTVLGNVSGITAIPVALNQAQLTALINVFTATLAGDVPASGGGVINFLRADGLWTVPSGSGPIPDKTVLGNVSGGPAVAVPLTQTQLTTLVNVFTSGLSGAVPASGGGTTTFLRADSSFAVPPTFTSGTPGYTPASGGGTTTFLRADGTFAVPPVSLGANPTASVGLTAVNGVATTFLRSDGAPAIDQNIVPTWSGVHTFNARIAANLGMTVAGGTFISRGISDLATALALSVAASGAVAIAAPTTITANSLVVNGASSAIAQIVSSGVSGSTGGADLKITRAGSTINQAGQGPNLFLNDSTNTTGYYLQDSGGQFELWSSVGAGPTLTQILKVLTTGGVVVNAPASGTALAVNTTGSLIGVNVATTATNSSTIMLVNGATKGIRFGASTTGSSIEGVDSTGVGTFQPLTIQGTTVGINATGTSAGIALGAAGNVTIAAPTSGANLTLTGLGNVMPLSIGGPAGAYTGLSINETGQTPITIYQPASSSDLRIQTNGQDRITVTSNGNVSVASPASGVALTVAGTTGQPALFLNGANTAGGVGATIQGNFTGSGNTNLLALLDTGNTNGVNLQMVGNGATTPNKTLRVSGGLFQIINSAYSAALLNLNDSAAMTLGTATGSFQGAGTLNAQGLFVNGVTVGTVTSVGSGVGITASPNPIVSTGTLAIDQAFSPTWTGNHNFTATSGVPVTITPPSAGAPNGLNLVMGTSIAGRGINITNTNAGASAISSVFMSNNTPSTLEIGITSSAASAFFTNGPAGAQVFFGLPSAIPISFGTAAIERMRIDGAGAVSINSPSSGAALTVNGATGGNIAAIGSSGAAAAILLQDGNVGNQVYQLRSGAVSIGTFDIFDSTAVKQRLQLVTGGNFTINAATSGTELTINTNATTGNGLNIVAASTASTGLSIVDGGTGTKKWSVLAGYPVVGGFAIMDSTDNSTTAYLQLSSAGLMTIIAATGVLIATATALTNGAGAAAGTLTNAPVAGNPTKWISINDNGTVRRIPAW